MVGSFQGKLDKYLTNIIAGKSNFKVGTQFLGQNSHKEKKKHNFCNIGKMKNWVSIFYRRMEDTILVINKAKGTLATEPGRKSLTLSFMNI